MSQLPRARRAFRRDRITRTAARLLRDYEVPDLAEARTRAAKRVTRARPRRGELPGDREILAELERLAWRDEREEAGERTGSPGDAGLDADDGLAACRPLLADLADVQQGRARHPEGDALTHSLQAYVLARTADPWDEELQTAALLHDVGKGIDYRDPVPAALEALDGLVGGRVLWLIEHQSEGRRWVGGDLGLRARRRLNDHPDGDALRTLARCDLGGTRRSMAVPELDAALDELRALAALTGGWE